MARKNKYESTNDKIVRLFNEKKSIHEIAAETEISIEVIENVLKRRIDNYEIQPSNSSYECQQKNQTYINDQPSQKAETSIIQKKEPAINDTAICNANQLSKDSLANGVCNVGIQTSKKKATVIPEANMDADFLSAIRHEPVQKIDVGDSGKSKLEVYMSNINDKNIIGSSLPVMPPIIPENIQSYSSRDKKISSSVSSENNQPGIAEVENNNIDMEVNTPVISDKDELIADSKQPLPTFDSTNADNEVKSDTAVNKMKSFIATQIENNNSKIQQLQNQRNEILAPMIRKRKDLFITLNQKQGQKRALEEKSKEHETNIIKLKEQLQIEIEKQNQTNKELDNVINESRICYSELKSLQETIDASSCDLDKEITELIEEVKSFKQMMLNY